MKADSHDLKQSGRVDAMALALEALARSWNPVPVHAVTKKPVGTRWQQRKITRENIGKYFSAKDLNVGLQMGPMSGGLGDTDLDAIEAVVLAPHFLPKTGAIYGRPGKQCSHRLYIVADPEAKAWIVWRDDEKKVLLELRLGGDGKGAQSVMPGSRHTSGEIYAWNANGKPAHVTCAELKAACAKVAAGALLMRHWPEKGALHDCALGIGGFMARAGWSPEEVEHFVLAICSELRDVREPKKHAKTARDSAEAFAKDEPVRGFPWLKETFGEDVANAVAKIVDYGGGSEADTRAMELNKDHALVIIGDKVAILKTVADDIKLLQLPAFENWFANQPVYITDAEGNTKSMSLAKYWLHHPQRRQYEGIVFAPGRDVPNHFNLWRGFAVEPKPGDCSKFLAHLKNNVCGNDEELYRWVVGWFANIFQNPEQKMGTSLVLRGKQGVGKTKVGEVIGSLLGPHYVLVADPRYITGRFNSHMVSCLLLHADEAFWAGDHAAEGKLKDLVTGKSQLIEYKGKEPVRIQNYLRLLVSGNQDWQVPAGFEERRFGTLDVGEEHMGDKNYFAAIDDEMDNGGREALLHHLLNFVDLTEIDLRTIPKTTALLEQKVASLNHTQAWWMDVLMRGELPPVWDEKAIGACSTLALFNMYIGHAQKQGVRRRAIETQLGMFLRKYVPRLRRRRRIKTDKDGKEILREYIYEFPALAKCREDFAAHLQQKIDWPKKEEWTEAETDMYGRLL
jgi:uncharacterized protein DUF5906/bifunctional DNA primase/polymerase-like protein